jgi:REP element-mobilizing transposase RayT
MGRADLQFTRKLSVRSVGENTRAQVEAYIRKQLNKELLIDAALREKLRQFTVTQSEVDLSAPAESARGRYWYNLHLVLVARDRDVSAHLPRLATLRDACLRIADKKSHAVSTLSVMPDHIHMALRGDSEHSSEQIALGYLNNLTYMLNELAPWSENYYVGTFSEYDMGAIRASVGERNTEL